LVGETLNTGGLREPGFLVTILGLGGKAMGKVVESWKEQQENEKVKGDLDLLRDGEGGQMRCGL